MNPPARLSSARRTSAAFGLRRTARLHQRSHPEATYKRPDAPVVICPGWLETSNNHASQDRRDAPSGDGFCRPVREAVFTNQRQDVRGSVPDSQRPTEWRDNARACRTIPHTPGSRAREGNTSLSPMKFFGEASAFGQANPAAPRSRLKMCGGYRKQISVSAIPEKPVDPFPDDGCPRVVSLFSIASGDASRGFEGEHMEDSSGTGLCRECKGGRPVGALLHTQKTGLIDILAFVPMQDSFRRIRIGTQDRTADDPPEAAVGIGAEVGDRLTESTLFGIAPTRACFDRSRARLDWSAPEIAGSPDKEPPSSAIIASRAPASPRCPVLPLDARSPPGKTQRRSETIASVRHSSMMVGVNDRRSSGRTPLRGAAELR